jgi:hypothetical protein
MVAGTAVQKLMMELSKQQEILMNVADMLNDVYVAESVLLRVEKMVKAKGEKQLVRNTLQLFAHSFLMQQIESINLVKMH